MNSNSTQSGTVNISVKVANPTIIDQPITIETTTTTPLTKVLEYQPISVSIFIIFGLVIHYLMTVYAVNNPLFPVNRNYQIPQKGFKAIVWKARTFPLMIALITGLYGLITARTMPIFIFNLVTWYFVFIEYLYPKFSNK
ncbi:hypothetical protein HYS10_01335 [Candidatus Collierbacteria bacterium]|nr:hypothetical protein [Candidatus Collierbacteria bacterium]